jgi:hypothetical protein
MRLAVYADGIRIALVNRIAQEVTIMKTGTLRSLATGFLALFIAVVSSLSNVYAKPPTPQPGIQPDDPVRDRAIAILKQYGSDIEGRERALAAEGWSKAEVTPVQATFMMNGINTTQASVDELDNSIGLLSSGSCGKLKPGNAYRQDSGSQLVVGNWEWTCTIYDYPAQPEDAFALGATDGNNNSLNQAAYNAGGWVEDTAGNRHDSRVWANSFNGSGVGYELDDTHVNGRWVGKKGGVYFYMQGKPTNSGTHYLQMCWDHTWNSTNAHISSVQIGYPWSFGVTIDNPTNVQQWKKCTNSIITYPHG